MAKTYPSMLLFGWFLHFLPLSWQHKVGTNVSTAYHIGSARFYWSSTFLLRSGVFSIFFVAAFHNNSMACIVAEASSSLNPHAQQFVPGVVAMVAHARPLVSLICDWRVLMRTASFSRSRLRSTPRAWRWPWRGPSHRSWLCDRLASVTVGFEKRLAGGTWLWLPCDTQISTCNTSVPVSFFFGTKRPVIIDTAPFAVHVDTYFFPSNTWLLKDNILEYYIARQCAKAPEASCHSFLQQNHVSSNEQ